AQTDPDDYPRALQERLAKTFAGESIEVINAGGNAFTTAHSLVNIELRLVEYQPDIIILMHNINDSTVNAYNGGATSDYSNKYAQPYYLNPALQGSLSLAGFLTQSRLLTRFNVPDFVADKKGDLNLRNDFSYGLQLFKRNLAAIASICKLHDIQLVILSQPNTMEPHRFVQLDAIRAYDKGIAEVAREQAVPFVDMKEQFGRDAQYFVDQVHYSYDGIDRFADILAEELHELVEMQLNPVLAADSEQEKPEQSKP
ncbi:MAG: SGNH/GDSL hydrolase family protein, partial [Gammaproteobacteria bacterium]